MLRRILKMVVTVVACAAPLFAQQSQEANDTPPSIFEHSKTSRWWVSGQANTIFQAHPGFHAAYSGENSLSPRYEKATSRVFTLFTGFELTHSTEVLFDIESAGGRGISDALGLAGFTNLDVVRNPELGSKPYLARLMLHQTFALSRETQDAERGPLSLAPKVPARRLEWRVGKFGTADFFDLNSAGSDSHLQFLNWTVDNNGGYDYAADTRGYTWGMMAEYDAPSFSLRFAETLMPKVANGIDFEWNLARARAENAELELHTRLLEHKGAVRLLSYVNHANMGDYREAIQRFRSGLDPRPIVENTRQQGRIKYGFGMNLEQELTDALRVFGRWGWNEGRHESFAYTEVNETLEFGADYAGTNWRRKHDRVGVALVSNGISKDHQEYLRLGGRGFLLGDDSLTYGRENIVELYYTAHLWRGMFASVDLQHINNPGYNRDRGPVTVPGLRLHVDF